jgi:hypothetical protein
MKIKHGRQVRAGGNVSSDELVTVGPSHVPLYSARDLMKLSVADRQRTLREICEEASGVYSSDRTLTAFEAFGEQDLYEKTP